MAINFTEKSERLLQSRRYTHDNYTDSQEAFTSTLDINANEVYVDQGLIPYSNLPFSGSGQSGSIYSVNGQNVAQYYYRWPLTRSNLVSGSANEVWFVLSPTGSSAGIGAQLIDPGQQTNFISPKYASSSLANATAEDATPGYLAKVFVSNNASTPAAGDVVSSNNYTFDYKTGVLQFTTNAVAPTTAQYVYITAYQYKGRLLSDSITNVSSSIAAISASIGGGGASGSLLTRVSNLEQVSASLNTFTASANSRLTNIESKTGSYATTGSNTFIGTQLVSGSMTITGNLLVQGSSSIQNISGSALNIGTNVILLNTAAPTVRFAGISVQDSGSNAGVTGSLFWDSQRNGWIYQQTSGASYSGGMLISGPENTGSLGSEPGLAINYIQKAQYYDHLTQSVIYDDGVSVSIGNPLSVTGSVTATSFIGSISATNNVVSSSSNTATIIHNISSGVISTYAAGGVVSGSSQIDINSVTNFSSFSSSVSTNFSSSAASVTSLSSSVSASLYTLSASVGSGNIGSSVSQLNSFSASVLTQLGTLANVTSSYNTFTASVNGHIADINTKTGSFESKFSTLQSLTASYSSSIGQINAETASIENRFTILASVTSSYNTFTASVLSETGSIEGRFATLANVTSSYNTFTASVNTQLSAIGTETASIEGRFATLASVTASINQVTASLNTYTASAISQSLGFNAYTASAISQSLGFNAETASIEGRFTILASVTSSYNAFTASVLSETGSIEGRFATLANVTSSYNTFTSSANSRLTNLETTSASANISFANLNTFTSSANVRLNNLESTSASVNISLANINSYTSSLIAALQVVNTNKLQTTSDLTVNGNLYVNGTTTTVNSTQVQLSSSVISVDAGGGVNGGIWVTDKIGTTGTGSFLWDVTNNYWIAGLSGSEQRILTVGGMNIVSGSSQIDVTQTTNFSTYSGSVSASLSALSASVGSGNVGQSITQLNAFTASLSTTSSVTFAALTASLNIPSSSVSGSSTSKRMAFRDINGTIGLVAAPTNVGDFVQWDGGSFVMSNIVDGGSF